MTFNSLEFAAFLLVVLTAYRLLPFRAQNPLLLLASYVFYGWWDYRFLSLLAISTIIDWTVGLRMAAARSERARRALLVVSLVANLGILATFKYMGFFVDSFERLLDGLGLDVSAPVIRVTLPVGISFYTFQTLSYTFDVYRRRMRAEPSLLTFATYVAYFPQLVAGPIERAKRLLPQLRKPRARPSSLQVRSALLLIASGLLKKVVLADGIAPLVNERFADPSVHGPLSLLLGAYGFAIQIYGDFSGYSSIARGTSRLFGIELMRNFEQPYLSRNITQFWRTWHISLSSWLHDYLYVPLGGNRGSRLFTYRNLMLTMLLGGLWHGAAWTFVIWGALHGLFLSVHRLTGAYERRGRPAPPSARDIVPILVTFHVVCFAWIFFRADSFSDAWNYLRGFGRLTEFTAAGATNLAAAVLLVAVFLAVVVVHDLADRHRDVLAPVRWRPARLGAVVGAIAVAIFLWSGATPQPFIYFQF